MRPWFILFLLLPAAAAQPWQDGSGDAEGIVADGALDLRELTIVEDAAAFTVRLTVGDLTHTQGWRADAGRWFVHLDHGMDRRIQFGRSYDGFWWAMLEEANSAEADGYAWAASLPVSIDEEDGRMEATIERRLLADAAGAPPVAGRTIEGIYVQSQPLNGDGGDRLPDTGTLALDVLLGPMQTGPITLSSSDPWRASNGAASTYIFTLDVQNSGPATDVAFTATDVPEAWSVLLPEPTVRMDAESSVQVPVVVQTPFAHSHGARQGLVIEARPDDPDAVGRVEIGIEYVAVPQPSGHHDTLWFHTRNAQSPLQEVYETSAPGGYYSYVVMNAVEDEEADTRESKEARPTNGPLRDRAYWFVPLSPALRMGLDFDVERTGTIEVPIAAPVPVEAAVLQGWMYHCVPSAAGYDCDSLAQWQSQPTDIEDRATLRADVVPDTVADRVPYAPQSYLSLAFVVDSDRPQSTTGIDQLQLEPGGWIRLPLNEYADPVDDIFANDALRLQTPQAEMVAPAGVPSVFDVVLDNLMAEPVEVELTISGTNAQWAVLEGRSERKLGSLERDQLRVVVTPPADAVGERADLILHAKTAHGPALLRLVATVDEPGQTNAEGHGREAPGLGLLGVVAVVLLARRR